MVDFQNFFDDSRPSDTAKKKLDTAIFDVARSGQTSEPLLMNVFISRRMNAVMGGPVFTPWDIPNMPEEVVETILSIEGIQKIQQGLNQVEMIFSKWRADHYGRIKH